VVVEIALTLVLLVGAGLLARSFANLVSVPRGFDTDRAITFNLSVSDRKYPTGQDQTRFFATALEHLAGLPGVTGAAIVNELPLGGGGVNGTTPVEGQTYAPDHAPVAEKRIVSPDYFRVMGIPILKGRAFSEHDAASSPGVAIVNEAYVRKYLAHDDPLRHRVGFNWDIEGWQQIVGVAGDVKHYGLDDPPTPMIYVSYRQRPIADASVVIKSALPPAALAPSIRRTVWAIDADRPVSDLRPMTTVVWDSLATWRLTMGLAAGFGLLGLVLAATGVGGVMSCVTGQRTREFGIRLALGASSHEIRRLALVRAVALALGGIGAGTISALWLTRFIASRLYDVRPTDPLTFAAAAAGLVLVAVLASYLPARRAARIDPAVVLRNE
jgi:putative ABC transport system permease protein